MYFGAASDQNDDHFSFASFATVIGRYFGNL